MTAATELLGFPVDVVIDDSETPPHILRTAVPLATEGTSEDPARWEVRPRSSAPDKGVPPAAEVLHQELVRIEHRIADVIAQGREEFVEGSDSYDRATVAVLRLAALFEDARQFSGLLGVVTLDERRGITTTRNIATHNAYGAINTEVFWHTVTKRLPRVITRIHAANRF